MDELLGQMLAHYRRVTRLRIWQLLLQLFVAVPAAWAVFSDDHPTLYRLAAVGVVLALIWVGLELVARRSRGAAERMRHAVQVWYGLGWQPPAATLRDLQDDFIDRASPQACSKYYATTLPAGPARLAEMLEESAFYTRALQAASGVWFISVVGLISATIGLTLLLYLPVAETEVLVTAARVVLVVIMLALSADVLGTLLGHREAAASANEALTALDCARKNGFLMPEVLLATSGYNAAASASPTTLPFVYPAMRDRLDRRWASYRASLTAAEGAVQ